MHAMAVEPLPGPAGRAVQPLIVARPARAMLAGVAAPKPRIGEGGSGWSGQRPICRLPWRIRAASAAAPNPLSMFMTAMPEAQLFSIARRAARPPKLAP